MERRVRPAAIAWAALIGGVALYDLTCKPGETLSEGVDTALEHPVGKYATAAAIAVTGAHLLNVFERFGVGHYDPIGALFRIAKGNNGPVAFTEAVEPAFDPQVR